MKNHTRVYIDHFYKGDLSADIVCEFCFMELGVETKANDTHHAMNRKSGGTSLLDTPDNLIALCREHHDLAECGEIPLKTQLDLHKEFANRNGTPIDENLLGKSLQERTKDFKDNA